jgi:hypothetical protein
MNCANCQTEFEGGNFGLVLSATKGGRVETVDLCSAKCRREYRRPETRPAPVARSTARSRNAETGVKIPRKKSAAEIRRDAGPRERDISASIASQLDGRGVWNTRTQSGAIRTASGHVMKLCRTGTPDRVAADGLHVWIEVKRPGEQASDEQAKVIEVLKSNGSLAFVIDDPADLALIFEGLRRSAREIAAVNGIVEQVQREIDQEIQKRKEKNANSKN